MADSQGAPYEKDKHINSIELILKPVEMHIDFLATAAIYGTKFKNKGYNYTPV